MLTRAHSNRYPLLWQFDFEARYSWTDDFARRLHSPDFVILAHDEDDRPTVYTWSSPHLNELSDLQDVMDRAKALLTIFDGAMLAYLLGQYWPFTLSAPVEPRQAYKPPRDNIFALPFSSHMDEWPESSRDTVSGHPISKYIYLSRYDETARAILAYLGWNGPSWVTLYGLRDFMKTAGWDDADLANAAGTTAAQVELFKRTANNHAALGPMARHGDLGQEPPKHPMETKRAIEIVLLGVRAFLDERYQKFVKAGL